MINWNSDWKKLLGFRNMQQKLENVLSLRHKKNMLGKSKQEITLTHRKEKGKVLAKNL
jgi:hypothetical protein